jgi:replicative DNA helicase
VEVLNAEQSLLGCILKDGDLIKEIALTNGHFADTRHQLIFQAMRELEDKDELIDIVSLTMFLNQKLGPSGSDYLADLMQSVPSTHNFKAYERYVLDAFKMRKVKEYIRSADDLTSITDLDQLNDILSKAQELLDQDQSHKFNMIETLIAIQDDIETVKEGINGITTGFIHLDQLLDGWKLQDLNIIAARPSVGKTAFMLSLADNAAKEGHFVDIFSLEMSAKLLLVRMICMIGRIDSMKIKNAVKRFSNHDWDKYTTAQGVLSRYKENLYISDGFSPTLQDIRSRTRQNLRDHPNKKHLVIIDYLTLIKGSGRKDRHLEIGEISRGLKRMARELNVSVILLSQLSRKVEQRQDKRPMLSDLRDSGEIEQDADTVTFLHRDDYYDAETEKKNIIEVIVAKNRNGPLGKVELAFLKEYNAFVNLVR